MIYEFLTAFKNILSSKKSKYKTLKGDLMYVTKFVNTIGIN